MSEQDPNKDIDHIDMLRDELMRIKAAAISGYRSEEIVGICERALSEIHRRVPFLVDLDHLHRKHDRLKSRVEVFLGSLDMGDFRIPKRAQCDIKSIREALK